MYLPSSHGDMPRPPGRDRAAIATDDGIIVQSLAKFARDDLRLHRDRRIARPALKKLVPLLHTLVRLVYKL